MGSPDRQPGSRSGLHTGPGKLEATELPHSVYDDLVQGKLPGRSEAANTAGRRRG